MVVRAALQGGEHSEVHVCLDLVGDGLPARHLPHAPAVEDDAGAGATQCLVSRGRDNVAIHKRRLDNTGSDNAWGMVVGDGDLKVLITIEK